MSNVYCYILLTIVVIVYDNYHLFVIYTYQTKQK